MALKKFVLIILLSLALKPIYCQNKSLEGMINRIYDALEKKDSLHKKNTYHFILPIWGVYPETGWRIGFSLVSISHRFNDSISRPSVLRFNTQYTQNNQFSIRPQLEWFGKENRYFIKCIYTYSRFSEYFWGIGNQSDEHTKALYTFEMNRIQARFQHVLKDNVYIGFVYHLENIGNFTVNSDSTHLFNPTIIGNNGYFMQGIGPLLVSDNRNQIFYPKQGHYLEVSFLWFPEFLKSEFVNENLNIDFRKYVSTTEKSIFAFQFISQYNLGNVPYRLAGTLGSDMYMRGYYNGRFRDQHMFALQCEWRKKIWGPLGICTWLGCGNVANTLTNLSYHIKPNYGIGIRGWLNRSEKLNLRLDWGFGEKNIQGVYFTVGEAF